MSRTDRTVAASDSGLRRARRRPPPLELPMTMADFENRGFRIGPAESRCTLERHAREFLNGYNCAAGSWRHVHERLAGIDESERGFAYEGAAMYARQCDLLTRGRTARLAALLAGPGRGYVHLVHVGAGWAFAPVWTRWARCTGTRPWSPPAPGPGLLGWLALDGSGFAAAFFGGHRMVARLAGPGGPPMTGRDEVRLAGVGRALWFLECADPDRITDVVRRAPRPVRAPLWSGIGLAAAYAGGAGATAVARLAEAAGPDAGHLGQGIAFAATARARSGRIGEPAATAVRTVLNADPAAVAAWADDAAAGLDGRSDVGAYLTWRERLRDAATAARDGRRSPAW